MKSNLDPGSVLALRITALMFTLNYKIVVAVIIIIIVDATAAACC
jgi:hypothetical protein